MINVFKPAMGDEEVEAVSAVLRSGWIGLGPRTAEFEKRFAEFSGVKYAVGVNSATAALDLAMKLLHISHGDEVIVPTMTFVSTAHVVAYNLATPIFVDVDPQTLNLDLGDVKKKIGPRTKAIIPVHYGGRPVDMDELQKIAGQIPIVEDCAHAAGASYKSKPVGGLGAIGCFSFHAVKNLAMGDGGALTLNSEEWCQRAKRLRWLGIDKGTWDRTGLDKSYWWQYHVDEIGLKCHMNDISASIGLVQLKKLPEMNGRRREIVSRYFQELADIPEIELPPEDDAACRSAWHIFHIKCHRRDELSVFLNRKGVATGVHYTPIHTYRCYGNRPTLKVAEQLQHTILTLPLYPGLTEDEVSHVVRSIREFYQKA
jgi:dTDP-4-amino-4,6-dideoxygalactose transaminase